MYCPNCLAEYRAGFTRCPDCDVELVPELIETEQGQLAGDEGLGADVVRIYTAPNPATAELIRGVLANEGIESAVYGGFRTAYPVNVGPLAEVSVDVRREDAERARELIQAAERGDFALDE
jgi:hypothetical protein